MCVRFGGIKCYMFMYSIIISQGQHQPDRRRGRTTCPLIQSPPDRLLFSNLGAKGRRVFSSFVGVCAEVIVILFILIT